MNETGTRITAKGDFCHLCGEPTCNRHKTYRHKSWSRNINLRVCVTCDKTKPRCEVCNLPMAEQSPSGLCETCSQTLKFCLTCRKPIQGEYSEFDGVGPYCQKCVSERQPCDICAAPLTDERWKLSDGRILCSFCNKSAILTKGEAGFLYEQMKSVVKTVLGMSLNVPTGLALVDRTQLAKVIREQRATALPDTTLDEHMDVNRTLGLYIRKGMRRGLYIQAGLPRLLFLQVAAHEFAHAWQGENCPLLKAELYHEGFAEWVAFQVIGHYGYIKGQKRMLARQDVYGDGLRLFQDINSMSGVSGVIDVCKKMD